MMLPKLYVGGTFDLLHPGHVHMFKTLSTLGGVIVSLNTDEFVLRYKGRPVVQTLAERTVMVRSCRWVAEVVTNIGDEDSRPAILSVMPDFVVHGTDWTGHNGLMKQMGLDQEFLMQYGITMLYMDLLPGISTTKLRERMAP